MMVCKTYLFSKVTIWEYVGYLCKVKYLYTVHVCVQLSLHATSRDLAFLHKQKMAMCQKPVSDTSHGANSSCVGTQSGDEDCWKDANNDLLQTLEQ